MTGTGKRVSLFDIERAFESGGHHSGSADRKIHERFLLDVMNDHMSAEALIFYGSCLEPEDVRFIKPWVDAMQRMIDLDPAVEQRIRLRRGLRFRDLATDTEFSAAGIQQFIREMGPLLRAIIEPDLSENPRLSELVRRLDCSCQ